MSYLNLSSSIAFIYIDILGFFYILSTCLCRVDTNFLEKAIPKLISTITQSTDRPLIRLTILNGLYNAHRTPSIRTSLFKSMLKFAFEIQKQDIVAPLIEQIDQLFVEWSTSPQEQRNIFSILFQFLDPYSTSNYRIKWLQTFDLSPEDIRDNINEIERTIFSFIIHDSHMLFEPLYATTACQCISKKNPPLHELLHILTQGTVSDYIEFNSNNKEFFEINQIDHPTILHKMRILHLVTLASKTTRIPHNVISDGLCIPLEDVEMWVLKAICAGVLNAKIDQVNQTLLVSYALQREFSLAQYQSLRDRIGTWKDNIGSMIKVVKNAQAQSHGEHMKALQQGLQSTFAQ